MVSLDIILQMQRQGMTDFEISKNLQSQGIPPREINEALNQAKIKGALSNSNEALNNTKMLNNNQSNMQGQNIPNQTQVPQTGQQSAAVSSNSNAQQSIMQQVPDQNNTYQDYPQDNYGTQNDQYYQQDPYNQGYNEGYYGDEYYDEGYNDNQSISEIAEQVVNEKFKEFNSKTGDLVSFKNNVEDQLKSLNSRITRIEETIDKLQHAIVQKIGEFGENTTLIRRDLENLHNTTSKLMNPLIDNYRELEKKHHKK